MEGGRGKGESDHKKTTKEVKKEVQDDPQVKFMLLQDNARALQHNQKKAKHKGNQRKSLDISGKSALLWVGRSRL